MCFLFWARNGFNSRVDKSNSYVEYCWRDSALSETKSVLLLLSQPTVKLRPCFVVVVLLVYSNYYIMSIKYFKIFVTQNYLHTPFLNTNFQRFTPKIKTLHTHPWTKANLQLHMHILMFVCICMPSHSVFTHKTYTQFFQGYAWAFHSQASNKCSGT